MRVRAHVLDRVVECREGNNQRVIWCVLGSCAKSARSRAPTARAPPAARLPPRCGCLMLLHQRVLPLPWTANVWSAACHTFRGWPRKAQRVFCAETSSPDIFAP